MEKQKIKRVFNMKLANSLIERGHKLIRTTPDKIYKGRIIYIFEMSDSFIVDFNKLNS